MKWTFSQKKTSKKTKKYSKTQLDEKTCLFMMLLIISFFSVSQMDAGGVALHSKR